MRVKVSRIQLKADSYAHAFPTKKVVDSYIGELLAIVPVNGRVCYIIADQVARICEEYVSDSIRIEVIR